jgi:ABC-type uncharacterized transport system substrate-binding protein
VYQALAAVADAGRKAGIPVILDDPSAAQEPGILAGVGVGHFYAGKATAPVLLDVLRGKKPAEIPLQNISVERVRLNDQTARDLAIEFSPEILNLQAMTLDPPELAQAVAVQSAAGAKAPTVAPVAAPAAPPSPGKKWRVEMLQYLETVPSEDAAAGIEEGLRSTGLVEGKDYVLHHGNAQGDIGALSSLIDNALADQTHLFITLSTPTLQAVVNKVKTTPVVFTFVSNPFIAGAGQTDEVHLPNITGVYTEGPFPELIKILREFYPEVKRLGTLFAPAEVNSVHNKDALVKFATEAGLKVETIAVNSPGELADAALALTQRKVQIITQVPDNQSASGFASIVKAARHARIPIFTLLGTNAEDGAVLVLARNYRQAGFEAGQMAAEVIRGKSPAAIPFHIVKKIDLVVNPIEARRIGFSLPEGLIRQAERVIGR